MGCNLEESESTERVAQSRVAVLDQVEEEQRSCGVELRITSVEASAGLRPLPRVRRN